MKKGWTWKPLGEVSKTGSGGTPLSSRKEYYDGGNIPWLVSGEVAQENVREAKNFITKAGLENSAAKLFPKDTVLVAMYGATAGQVGILRFEAATNQAVCGILPNEKFVPEFLFYFLLAKKDELVAQATGNAQPNISQIKIKNTEVPLPPLAEQQRIVGLLDEAFEGLATAKANAEKNLQNARALFESHLQSVFTQRGPGWVEKSLGDVCEFVNGDRGKNYPNRNEYVETGIPWINTGHIQPNGTLSMEEMNFITREKFDSLRSGKIQSGDLVYCLRGATLGKTALVDPLTEGAVASSLVILRPSSHLDGSFLYFFLTSPAGQGLIKGFENGAAQPNLGAKSVAKYPISFPKLPEQREIADSLIELREETQRLARLYEQKLALLTALKKSLLHQAFTGEL
jgi:type I restriction enzyme S subunit